MGQINIDVRGSFRIKHSVSFSAMNGGHADAVAQAIEFLSAHVLPDAVRQDHAQQAKARCLCSVLGCVRIDSSIHGPPKRIG